MESMGNPPTHDDDWDQCPARTRPVWPSHLVPWWQPTQPTDKPPYTYATLVAFAILLSKDGRLLLSDIYRWIAQTYPYYVPNQRGWQNSIRHNLSLNKQWFQKVDRRPTQANPGKGCYWTLVVGCEQAFIDTITHGHHDVTPTMKITRPEDYQPPTKPSLAPMYTTFRMTTVTTTAMTKRKRQNISPSQRKKVKSNHIDDDDDNDDRWECDSGVDINYSLETTTKKQQPDASPPQPPVEYNILDHFLDQLPDPPFDNVMESILGDVGLYFDTIDTTPSLLLTSSFAPPPPPPLTTKPDNTPEPLVIHLDGDDMADQYLTFDEDEDDDDPLDDWKILSHDLGV
ncbi:hypothetical protein [Absidia glauca]|uniref:Fork-head domain-containing protein n=1 Tax=Absidia glauca TaxID=4829 RepID=A0A168M0P1_ABSGL|nr:hypothetical protein [Absidia glauca]